MIFKKIVEIAAAVIVSLGGGGAIVFTLSGYLGKIWADRSPEDLRQEHTKLNVKLAHKLALVTEQANHLYQMAALEHQIRFSKLHETRGEVIAKLYSQLVDLQYAGQRYVLIGGHEPDQPTRDREYSQTSAKMNEVFFFIEQHPIYLPEHICTLLKEFIDAIKGVVISVWVYGRWNHPTSQNLEKQNEIILKAAEAFEGRIPTLTSGLKDEFRKILGVDDPRNPDSLT